MTVDRVQTVNFLVNLNIILSSSLINDRICRVVIRVILSFSIMQLHLAVRSVPVSLCNFGSKEGDMTFMLRHRQLFKCRFIEFHAGVGNTRG